MRYFRHAIRRDREIGDRIHTRGFSFPHADTDIDSHLYFSTTNATNVLQFFMDRENLQKEYYFDPIAGILTEAVVATDYAPQFSDMPVVSVVTAVERNLRHGTTTRYVGPEGDYADGVGDQQAADVRLCMMNALYMDGPGSLPISMDWVRRCFDHIVSDMSVMRQQLVPCTYTACHTQSLLLHQITDAAASDRLIGLDDNIQGYDLARRVSMLSSGNVPLQKNVPSHPNLELSAEISPVSVEWDVLTQGAVDLTRRIFWDDARSHLVVLMLVDLVNAPAWCATARVAAGDAISPVSIDYAPHLELSPKTSRSVARRAIQDILRLVAPKVSTILETKLTYRLDVMRTVHDELAIIVRTDDKGTGAPVGYAVLDLLNAALASPSIAEIYS